MTNDDFMSSAWRKPPPALARSLRERLRRLDERRAHLTREQSLRAAAWAAVVLMAVGLFTFPAVQAGARAFLDLFRVVNFTAVPIERQRLQALVSSPGLDLPRLLGKQVEHLKPSTPPQTVATAEEASRLASTPLHLPAWLPNDLAVQQFTVEGAQSLRITASATQLRQLLSAQGIEDITVPDSLEGQTIRVDVPPVVAVSYGGSRKVILVQARSPVASLPSGVDLPRLAEAGLRILGIERGEAYRLAQSIDWRTTLILPVPVDVASFRQVDVQGHTGLLIQSAPRSPHAHTELLWSSGGQVMALMGDVRPEELFEMAQSTQ